MVDTLAEPTEKQSAAFHLKGSLFTLTVIQLLRSDMDAFAKQLREIIAQSPKFFAHAPVVVDLSAIDKQINDIDFIELNRELRFNTLVPVGVRGGQNKLHDQAKAAGLAVFPASKAEDFRVEKNKTQPEKKAAPVVKATSSAKLVTKPVRSGQQIYARGGDLIIVSTVSHGAELLADGNIHVYGTLRGRALAGVNGDDNARIFCKILDADMISIAGRYRLRDEKEDKMPQHNVQILLKDDQLEIAGFE